MKISVETRKPPIAKNVKAFQVRLTSLMSFKTAILTIKLKKIKGNWSILHAKSSGEYVLIITGQEKNFSYGVNAHKVWYIRCSYTYKTLIISLHSYSAEEIFKFPYGYYFICLALQLKAEGQ